MPARLATIYERFHARLRAFVRHRVADPYAVDDILQDVFVKIHAQLPSLRRIDRLESWVFQITRNAIIDHYRRGRPHAELPESLAAPAEADQSPPAQLAASVRAMLGCLPAEDRRVLELTDLEGLPQGELARRLGLSVSGAKSRVQRARARLRAAFLDCCHFELNRAGQIVSYHPRCAQCAEPGYPGECAPDGATRRRRQPNRANGQAPARE